MGNWYDDNNEFAPWELRKIVKEIKEDMRKKDPEVRDCEDCLKKIKYLLKEYNCNIEYDEDMELVIIVDKDNYEFEVV